MNVFVKKKKFLPLDYSLGNISKREITRSMSMKYFIALILYCQIAF